MNLTIADKYEILRPLGQGGMAEVLLAKQRGVVGIDKLVVIKRILPQYASEKSFVAMFLDEARVAADLVHPNVVSVHEVGESEGSYYLVLEYLQGRDLRRLQRRLEKSARPIPAGHVVRIALDAAEGLHYAHTKKDLEGKAMNIVHRDVSPQNIVVTWDGSAKILDFGIAKADSQQEHTETGIIKGKYTYMSPEQARGQKVDARSDQFSLGVILWELLTGKRLFKRDNDVAIVTAICEEDVSAPSDSSEIPKDLDKVVLKMLSKEPSDRYDSLRDVTLALEDCVSNTSLSASQARLGTYLEELFLEELERERRLNDISSKLLFDKTQSQAEPNDDDATLLDAKVRSTVLRAQRFPLRLDDDSTAPARSRMRAPLPLEKGVKGRGAVRPLGEPLSIADDVKGSDGVLLPPSDSFAGEDVPATLVLPRRQAKELAASVEEANRSRMPFLLLAGVAALLFVGLGVGLLTWWSTPPAKGDVALYSEPPGARILLDGAITGKVTPGVLRGVSLGKEHRLRIEKDGFVPLNMKIKIPRKRGEHRIDFTLKRLEKSPIAPAGNEQPKLLPLGP